MATAKKLSKTRVNSPKMVDVAELSGIAEKTEIAGPGFINIFLDKNWLTNALNQALA